jgi:uncharacterized membrane protein YphA (DoxX/SURF4 family)
LFTATASPHDLSPCPQDRITRVLSISLSVIFYWFGIQKFFPGASPAEDIASSTIHELTAHLVPLRLGLFLLACWEIALGVSLLVFPRTRLILWAAFLHLCLTFTPFVIFPGQTFGSAAGSLTLLGQYIVKNLVLLAGLYTLVELERAGRTGGVDPEPERDADLGFDRGRLPWDASHVGWEQLGEPYWEDERLGWNGNASRPVEPVGVRHYYR